MGFGNKLRDMLPSLTSEAIGKPGPAPEGFSAVAFIKGLDLAAPAADWPEADLRAVVQYLRGSKLLRLPDEVKAVFPLRV